MVPFSLRFREPYVTARGRLEERQLALLRLRAEGAEGLGEAAPLALRGGTPLALIVEELDALWRPQLMGEQLSGDPEDHVRGVAEFSPQARDAVKMALFDLVGQLSDMPVWRLLGATAAGPVRCNATLVAGDPEAVADNARNWAARGFETFKLKVGMDGDVAQVLAVREAVGPQARIRVDANGSWPVDTAVERLREMAPLELAEQPVATLEEMAALRARTDVLLSADESVVTPEDARGSRARVRRRDREAREGRGPAGGDADRRAHPGLSVERARRAGRDRRRRPRGAGDRRQRVCPRPRHIPSVRRHRGRAGVRRRRREPPPPRRSGPRSADRRGRAREQAHRARLAFPASHVDATNRNTALASALVEELARAGVAHACVSPGSRSAPLARALWQEPAIRVWTHVDERSGGFFALGIAQQTGVPVVVLTTSGTAGANLHPAVAEASEARVPLIVITADRPPELRGRGAGQTIDQLKLYGSAVRWFCELGVARADDTGLLHYRSTAVRAVAESRGRPPGPVHLNVALTEPLAPDPAPGEVTASNPLARDGRPGGAPLTAVPPAVSEPSDELIGAFAELVSGCRRGVILAGRQGDPELGATVAALARACGYPVLPGAHLPASVRPPRPRAGRPRV